MPLSIHTKVVVRHVETIVAWWSGLAEKVHPSFGWCASSLSTIAGYASTDYIFPAMLPTTPSRYDMIQSELLVFPTTILTDIPVTVENLELGHSSLPAGSPNEVNKANHQRDIEDIVNGMEITSPIL